MEMKEKIARELLESMFGIDEYDILDDEDKVEVLKGADCVQRMITEAEIKGMKKGFYNGVREDDVKQKKELAKLKEGLNEM